MKLIKRIVMKVVFNHLERYALQRALETEIYAMIKSSSMAEGMPYTKSLRELRKAVHLKGCQPFKSIS